MNLLSLPADAFFFNIIGLAVCAIIIVTCVCRLNVEESMPWRLSLQQVMLVCFAFWAAGTFVDLFRGHLIGFHGAAAGLGILIYLAITYKEWLAREKAADGDPAFAPTEHVLWDGEEDHVRRYG